MRKQNKTSWPLLILTVTFWGVLGAVVFLVDPAILKDLPFNNSYAVVFLIWGLAWFSLLTLISQNSRRGLIYSLSLTLILILRLIRLGNVVNIGLILGLTLAIDLYFASG